MILKVFSNLNDAIILWFILSFAYATFNTAQNLISWNAAVYQPDMSL